MKPLTLLLPALLLVFYSCDRKPEQTVQQKKHEVPKPLQNDNKDFSLISKRTMDENLVEEIYADMAKKDKDLRALEDQRQRFNEGHADSVREFDDFDEKSNNYYTSAAKTLTRITDTVLRQRLRVLLAGSQKSYKDKVAKFTYLINKMDNDQREMPDYYLALKVAATLPVMEDYQANNMPDGKRIRYISDSSRKLLLQTQKLAEQYIRKVTEKK